MYFDIVTALELQKCGLSNKLLVAVKDIQSDLGFVFSEVISFYTEKGYAIIIVNFGQSLSHFKYLLSKSSMNVKSMIEKSRLCMVDVFSDLETLIYSTESESLTSGDQNDVNRLKYLYHMIANAHEQIRSVESDKPKGVLLFIDEINVLLNLGFPLKVIQPFLKYCSSLCTAGDLPCSMLVGGISAKDDAESEKLLNYLFHMSDIVIHVERFSIDCSSDAHGKILLEMKDKKENNVVKRQRVVFKIENRGAKLLHLGL